MVYQHHQLSPLPQDYLAQCKVLHALLQYFVALHLVHFSVVLLSRICREHPAHASGTPLLVVAGSAVHCFSRREELTHV
jgi:hypothetical protein